MSMAVIGPVVANVAVLVFDAQCRQVGVATKVFKRCRRIHRRKEYRQADPLLFPLT